MMPDYKALWGEGGLLFHHLSPKKWDWRWPLPLPPNPQPPLWDKIPLFPVWRLPYLKYLKYLKYCIQDIPGGSTSRSVRKPRRPGSRWFQRWRWSGRRWGVSWETVSSARHPWPPAGGPAGGRRGSRGWRTPLQRGSGVGARTSRSYSSWRKLGWTGV